MTVDYQSREVEARPLSPRQLQLYKYIRRYIERRGVAPTLAEMATHLNVTSSGTVHEYLSALEWKGVIERIPLATRGIVVTGGCPYCGAA